MSHDSHARAIRRPVSAEWDRPPRNDARDFFYAAGFAILPQRSRVPAASEPPSVRTSRAPRTAGPAATRVLRLGVSHDRSGHDDTADAVDAALGRLGHDVVRLGAGPDLFDALRALGPARSLDGVINLAGGHGDRGRASQVPALLTTLGIPHTGADPLALALALDDGLARSFAAAHGIPAIPHEPFTDPDPAASHALTELLPGDEYSVGVLGNGDAASVLCVTCRPASSPPSSRPPSSRDPEARARADQRLAAARATALDVHRAFGCRDISRVELRCDPSGTPTFVAVDPLPDLHPAGDLARGARRRGWSHDELVRRFLAAALDRWLAPPRNASPEPHEHAPRPPAPARAKRAGARCASPSPTTPTRTSNPI